MYKYMHCLSLWITQLNICLNVRVYVVDSRIIQLAPTIQVQYVQYEKLSWTIIIQWVSQ